MRGVRCVCAAMFFKLDGIPEPPEGYVPPLGSSRNTWTNIYKNKGRIDYCVQQFGVCCPPHARARDPRPGPRAAAAGSGRAGREADDGGGFRAGVFFFARRDHSQAQVEAAGRVGAQRVRRCILRDKACASIRHMHCTYVTAAGRAGQRGLRQQGGAPERGGPPGTETFSGDAALGHTRARARGGVFACPTCSQLPARGCERAIIARDSLGDARVGSHDGSHGPHGRACARGGGDAASPA